MIQQSREKWKNLIKFNSKFIMKKYEYLVQIRDDIRKTKKTTKY